MGETKHILKSKTFLFNALLALLAVGVDHVDLLQSYLSDGGYMAVMMIASVVNIYLRSITTQGVRLTK